MVKKYRKLPVEIEALQYTGEFGSSGDFFALREFIGKALIPYVLDMEGTLGIETLEGVMRVSVGDYVVKGVEGEFYPCKPAIFLKTYEEV